MQQDQQQDQQQTPPSGNIWGWKFSLFGLALILLMAVVMYTRHKLLDKPFDGWSPPQEQRDSLQSDTISSTNQ